MAGFYQLLEIAPEDIKGEPKHLAELLDRIVEDEKKNPVCLYGWIIYSKFHTNFAEWFDKDLRKAFNEYSGNQCRIYTLVGGAPSDTDNLRIDKNTDGFIDQEFIINLARMLRVEEEQLPGLILYEKFQEFNPEGILLFSFREVSSRDKLAQVLEKLGTLLYESTEKCDKNFDRDAFIDKLTKIERQTDHNFILQKIKTFQPVIQYFADLLGDWIKAKMGF